MVALSRVYLGVHFTGDILWGAAVGLGLAAGYAWLKPRLLPRLVRLPLGVHVLLALTASAAMMGGIALLLAIPFGSGQMFGALYSEAWSSALEDAATIAGLAFGLWVGLALEDARRAIQRRGARVAASCALCPGRYRPGRDLAGAAHYLPTGTAAYRACAADRALRVGDAVGDRTLAVAVREDRVGHKRAATRKHAAVTTRCKTFIGVLAGLLLLAAAIYLAFGVVFYLRLADVRGSCGQHSANRPDRIVFDDNWPPIDLSRYVMPRYETVRFPSRQPGINLAGWWVQGDPGAAAVILVHGLGGCKNAIDVLVPAGMLWRNGFSVLLIDLRNIGDSDFVDGRSAAGNTEYQDVLGAWDWLITNKGYTPHRVGIFGESLGGATALFAFGSEPRVAALFLESTYADLEQVVAEDSRSQGLPAFLASGVILMGKVIGRQDLLARDPVDVIRQAGSRPIYIVHSREDTRVPIDQAQRLVAAARVAGDNVTAWFTDHGEHVQTPAVYPEEFERRLVGFFRQSLGE